MITTYNAEQMTKKSQCWVDLRHRVLPHVIQFIADKKELERKWIEQNILSTPGFSLPMTINKNSFSKGFWSGPKLQFLKECCEYRSRSIHQTRWKWSSHKALLLIGRSRIATGVIKHILMMQQLMEVLYLLGLHSIKYKKS